MSRVPFVRVAVLSLALALMGCGGCQTELVKTTGVFVLTPQILPFNTVCLNSTSDFPLTLRNDGQGIIKIKEFSFSDPAFTLLDDMPEVIAPRQTVVVRVGFTPTEARAYSGFFTVTTDTKQNPVQKATLLGTGFNGEQVDFEVSCECESAGASGLNCGLADDGHMKQQPCRFLNFGQVVAGTTAEATVTVHNLGCQPVQFTQAYFYDHDTMPTELGSLYASWYSIDPATPQVIRGGEAQKYTVQFAPTIDGQPTARLTLMSNDPTPTRSGQFAQGAWDLGLFGEAVKPALLVDPAILTFYDAAVGTPETKTFLVDNTGTGDLTVESITIAEEGGTHDYQLQNPRGNTFLLHPGDQEVVSVTFTASGSGGRRATVTVNAGQDQATVRLLGGVEPELHVTWVDPLNAATELEAPVDFGNGPPGMGATRTVRVHNIGRADLSITAMVANDITNAQASTAFSVQGFTATSIPPAGSHDFTVVFADDVSIRNDIGKLAITSNDPLYSGSNNQATVDLTSTNEPNYAPIPNISFAPASPTGCTPLTLDASATVDPEGDPVTYKWSVARAQPGSHISLGTPNAATTTVTSDCGGPDVPGNYVFELTVVDQYPRNSVRLTQAVRVQ